MTGALGMLDRLVRRTLLGIVLVTTLAGAVACGNQLSSPPRGSSQVKDCLLLFDSTSEKPSDINFRRIATFYGLSSTELDVAAGPVTESMLLDKRGDAYGLIAIDAETLSRLLDAESAAALARTAHDRGSYVFVSAIASPKNEGLALLTGREILGASLVKDSRRDYTVTRNLAALTREFTGLTVTDTTPSQHDLGLVVSNGASHVSTVVTSTDDGDQSYPIFALYSTGHGGVFALGKGSEYSIGAGRQPSSMKALYTPRYFTEILPMMMAMRYVFGERVWHSQGSFANLTIDDPVLREPYGYLSYPGVLASMRAHDFHMTIGVVPANWASSEPAIVDLFLANPQRFSVAIHGDDHADCSEFGPDAPLIEKERRVAEATGRMDQLQSGTGIRVSKVMIFPCGVWTVDALPLLRKYGLLATVNGGPPLGIATSLVWDTGMYPADLDSYSYPVLNRRPVSGASLAAFDLFVGKPILLYGHHGMFKFGDDAFSPIADEINGIWGGVQWRSLEYIARRLYLQKTDRDGTVRVRMFGERLLLENELEATAAYVIERQVEPGTAARQITANGVNVPFATIGGWMSFSVRVPPRSSTEIALQW